MIWSFSQRNVNVIIEGEYLSYVSLCKIQQLVVKRICSDKNAWIWISDFYIDRPEYCWLDFVVCIFIIIHKRNPWIICVTNDLQLPTSINTLNLKWNRRLRQIHECNSLVTLIYNISRILIQAYDSSKKFKTDSFQTLYFYMIEEGL